MLKRVAAIGGLMVFGLAIPAQAAPALNIKSIAVDSAISDYTIERVGASQSALLAKTLGAMSDPFYQAIDQRAYKICKQIVGGELEPSDGRTILHGELSAHFYPIAKTPQERVFMKEFVSIVRFSSIYNNCREIGDTDKYEMVP